VNSININMFMGMIPEHILLFGVLIAMFIEMLRLKINLLPITILVLIGSLTSLAILPQSLDVFEGHFSISVFSQIAKMILVVISLPIIVLTEERKNPKYHALFLSALYGAFIMLSSDSFLTFYIGLEIMSIPLYVLAMISYRNSNCVEAAFKYVIMGSVASAIFLLGVACVFGVSGTIDIASFSKALHSGDTLGVIACSLVFIAFFMKVGLAPFHFWTPDVYQGSSFEITALMSTVTKAALVISFIKIIGVTDMPAHYVSLLGVIAIVSIVWGNVAAMVQTSMKRMLAYSSISHAAYMVFSLMDPSSERTASVYYYVLTYGLFNVICFAGLSLISKNDDSDDIENLKGLFRTRPLVASVIAMSMLSLAGIPPFPGFFAKFYIFKNVIAAGHPVLATTAFIGSFIGIYFYLKIIVNLFMSEAVTKYGESNRRYGILPIFAIIYILMVSVPTLINPDLFATILK